VVKRLFSLALGIGLGAAFCYAMERLHPQLAALVAIVVMPILVVFVMGNVRPRRGEPEAWRPVVEIGDARVELFAQSIRVETPSGAVVIRSKDGKSALERGEMSRLIVWLDGLWSRTPETEVRNGQ